MYEGSTDLIYIHLLCQQGVLGFGFLEQKFKNFFLTFAFEVALLLLTARHNH